MTLRNGLMYAVCKNSVLPSIVTLMSYATIRYFHQVIYIDTNEGDEWMSWFHWHSLRRKLKSWDSSNVRQRERKLRMTSTCKLWTELADKLERSLKIDQHSVWLYVSDTSEFGLATWWVDEKTIVQQCVMTLRSVKIVYWDTVKQSNTFIMLS